MVLGSSALAVTHPYSSKDHSFSSSWQAADSGTDWVIEYGFDKFLIDEDYAHTLHNSLHHTATVTNANGSYSDDAGAGNWAKVDITHSGATVSYSIQY